MCDFCGCPVIEPFASLTDDHATLEVLAELFDEGADPLDLEALRVSWEDHRATQAAVHSLARSLDLTEALEAGAGEDARLDALLAEPAPDGLALRRAVQGHIESWEFEVFPQLVLAADPDELKEAARGAAMARGS